jgi:hypothetical protein
MESHNFERLKAHILPLSVSKMFETARLEWQLVGVEISEGSINALAVRTFLSIATSEIASTERRLTLATSASIAL